MFVFIVRRVTQAVFVMLVISLLGFSVKHQIGDPVRDLVGVSVSAAEREALKEKMGLNAPFLIQYFRFVKDALHGDLGHSFFFKKPALDVILAKAPATFELVIVTSFIIDLLQELCESGEVGLILITHDLGWCPRLPGRLRSCSRQNR